MPKLWRHKPSISVLLQKRSLHSMPEGRVPFALREKIDTELDKLIEQEVLEPVIIQFGRLQLSHHRRFADADNKMDGISTNTPFAA
ncbi:hypothetical protein T07_3099 [Trichinella nelsoni]|uniref:Uncharacterized protein n=1 Tax=Trichinella nelsoni TaxID=6336 RepID=A0A0V0SG19_9BILA|nr:hypothetical protein T07_3099 [Trichinella nelsoni]